MPKWKNKNHNICIIDYILMVKLLPAIAIVCITILEAIALFEGIDGAILSMVIATIAGLAGGLGGYHAGKRKSTYRYREEEERL